MNEKVWHVLDVKKKYTVLSYTQLKHKHKKPPLRQHAFPNAFLFSDVFHLNGQIIHQLFKHMSVGDYSCKHSQLGGI